MLAILGVVNLVMPIWAIFQSLTKPNTAFRYPLILRLF
jgi:hypothetical protein